MLYIKVVFRNLREQAKPLLISRSKISRCSFVKRGPKLFIAAILYMFFFSVSLKAQDEQGFSSVPDITDCARAIGRNKYFCGSKTWRASEKEVHRLTEEAEQVGPMWFNIYSNYELWKSQNRNTNASLLDIHAEYQHLAESLQRLEISTKEFILIDKAKKDLENNCLIAPGIVFPTFMMSCRVTALTGVAPGLIAQSQEWQPPGDPNIPEGFQVPHSTSVVIFEQEALKQDLILSDSDSDWHPVAWVSLTEGLISTPILSNGQHGTFITIPMTEAGSSAISEDVVIRRVAPLKWREIDTQTWHRELKSRITRPLYPKWNAPLDIANLSCRVTLARPEDSNASPTGGEAEVNLIIRGDVMEIDGVIFKSGPKLGVSKAPSSFHH